MVPLVDEWFDKKSAPNRTHLNQRDTMRIVYLAIEVSWRSLAARAAASASKPSAAAAIAAAGSP